MEAQQPVATTAGSEGRIARGWRLTAVAWRLIRGDRTLLALALMALASAIVFTGLIFWFGGLFAQHRHGGALALAALALMYPSALAGVFLNVAIAAATSAAFDGEAMSVGEALRIAYGKRGRIALWALIASVVGVLISELASRLPGGSKLVAWFAGAAWALATIFVVPILALEGVGARQAIRRSNQMVRSRWGEGLTGNVAISAWAFLLGVPLGILLGVGIAVARHNPDSGYPIAATAMLGLVSMSALVATTRQVFAVALYRYSIAAPAGDFPVADLEGPFVAGRREGERRKSWVLRIGGTFLALFAVLMVVVAIFHPDRPHTAAEGYFHIDYASAAAPAFSEGSPVEYRGMRIGEVLSLTPENGTVALDFRVDPAYRAVVEANSAFPVGPPGTWRLCIGTVGECRAAQRPSGSPS